ncbi:DedA family protein [Euzebya tangerina]|uniref:DedA family protein n=1 Tax=Euzebya tangerina TaxID=591198 RepID=UPI000E3225A5|nr:DedA family protein [Euzebya tangerina]
MSGIVDAILGMSGTAAYVAVGLLAFGEAAAFIGLVLPGELAVILGGVVVAQGNASLPVMIAVASVAAIAGDSVGYEMGRHFGPRIVAWEPFQRRYGEKVIAASAYLRERGGRAVFVGRWTSLLRALVPGLAGMSKMPYGRFLVFNVVGGVAWATTFVLVGYLAGASWRVVERVAGRASLLLLVLIVVFFLVRAVTRRLLARTDRVRQRLDALAGTPAVRWVRSTFSRPMAIAANRVTPGASRGLGWTMSAVLVGASGWVVGFVIQDVLAREELVLLDRPVASWVADHTTAAATRYAEMVTDLFGPPIGIWFVASVVGITWWRVGRGAAIRPAVAAALAGLVATLLSTALPTTLSGTSFPSLSVAWVMAAVVATVAAVGQADLRLSIRLAGAGTATSLAVALADLVSADVSLSGVVAGFGVGTLIAAGVEFTARSIAPSPGVVPDPAPP